MAMWLPREGLGERGWGCRGSEGCGARDRDREVQREGVDEHGEGEAQPREGAPGDRVLVTLDLELPSRAFLGACGRELAAGRRWGPSKGNCCRSCSLKGTETKFGMQGVKGTDVCEGKKEGANWIEVKL